MRQGYQRHPVQLPATPNREAVADTSGLMATLFTIEPVNVSVVFDEDPPRDCVSLVDPKSSRLLELLSRANLERGTVIALSIRAKPVSHAALARLNWFLHQHGFTRGFRGWRRARQDHDGGLTMWKCAAAWTELRTLLRL